MSWADRLATGLYCGDCVRAGRRETPSDRTPRTAPFREYTGSSPERLFAACLRVVGQHGWKVQYTEPTTKTLSFVAMGQKRRIAGGMEMSVLVGETGGGGVRVSLGASPAGFQAIRVFDFGERDEISQLFFETLEQVLPDVPEPEPHTAPQSASAVDELERLAELHARGALDDEEFRRAKQRLLN